MKKTYNKLDVELLLIESEGGFMNCSIHARPHCVDDYEEYFKDEAGNDSSWDISFD